MIAKAKAISHSINDIRYITGEGTEQARAPMYNRNAVRLYLGISRNSYLLMLLDTSYRMRIVNWHSDRKHRMI